MPRYKSGRGGSSPKPNSAGPGPVSLTEPEPLMRREVRGRDAVRPARAGRERLALAVSAEGSAPDGESGNAVVLRTLALTKRFGRRTAVESLNIEVNAGAVTGFVGANGAGKTTTMGMLLGLLRPTSGSGFVLGAPISRPAAYLRSVGALIESPAFYPALTGRVNLEVLRRLGGIDRSRTAVALEMVDLSARADEPVSTYSLGMRQRLGIAAALLPDPQLLILDEPTNGLDPAGIREIRALMRSLAERGIAVFVSSHLLGEIQAVCDRIVLIDCGRVRYQGSVEDLLAAHRPPLLAAPEDPADARRLLELCLAAGKDARLDGEYLYVNASGTSGAELNRLASSAGITLRELRSEASSLEEAFFSMTLAR